jgi:tetratricopeptide (TPR) repeat protein
MRRQFFSFSLGLLICALMFIPVLACLWDYDTLAMERQRFPETLELITGKFLRHSPEFYHWRIADREKKLQTDPENLAYYDDLAVAYDKVGDHAKAIETILIKEKRNPGIYETYANLGTFYFHSGQFVKGLEYIDKAIAINPDAHFGREIYQKLLVKYVTSKMKDGSIPLPLGDDKPLQRPGFVEYLYTAHGMFPKEIDAATKGILGMMKFGNHASPILLEALGDLLLMDRERTLDDAKQLAARAYLKASIECKDPSEKAAYERRAKSALNGQTPHGGRHTDLSIGSVYAEFRPELAEAEKWYVAVRNDELAWIENGENPEVMFARKYYKEPALSGLPNRWLIRSLNALAAMAAIAAILLARRYWKRWSIAKRARMAV